MLTPTGIYNPKAREIQDGSVLTFLNPVTVLFQQVTHTVPASTRISTLKQFFGVSED